MWDVLMEIASDGIDLLDEIYEDVTELGEELYGAVRSDAIETFDDVTGSFAGEFLYDTIEAGVFGGGVMAAAKHAGKKVFDACTDDYGEDIKKTWKIYDNFK